MMHCSPARHCLVPAAPHSCPATLETCPQVLRLSLPLLAALPSSWGPLDLHRQSAALQLLLLRTRRAQPLPVELAKLVLKLSAAL